MVDLKTCALFLVSPSFYLLLLLYVIRAMASAANQGDPDTAKTIYEFSANDIKGNEVSLEKYRGNVVIVVNVASKCGYTAQHYKELNELYSEFGETKGEIKIRRFKCCKDL